LQEISQDLDQNPPSPSSSPQYHDSPKPKLNEIANEIIKLFIAYQMDDNQLAYLVGCPKVP
jgi:hypothetical protein